MNDLKIAILGKEDFIKTSLLKNLSKNATNVEFNGMSSGIDIGYTYVNGKRVYLFGGSSKERKRFFEEVLPAGIDLGVVLVNSKDGISNEDKETIEDFKENKMPCMVFFNDKKEREFHNFGKNIVHGSVENSVSAKRWLDFLTKMS